MIAIDIGLTTMVGYGRMGSIKDKDDVDGERVILVVMVLNQVLPS